MRRFGNDLDWRLQLVPNWWHLSFEHSNHERSHSFKCINLKYNLLSIFHSNSIPTDKCKFASKKNNSNWQHRMSAFVVIVKPVLQNCIFPRARDRIRSTAQFIFSSPENLQQHSKFGITVYYCWKVYCTVQALLISSGLTSLDNGITIAGTIFAV